MNDGLIPNRYAKALYKYAAGQDAADSVYVETGALVRSYMSEPGLAKAVENPFLPVADKVKVLLSASAAAAGKSLDRFFKLVFSYGRESMLLQMALSYGKLYREANGISQVVITTATEFPETDLKKIRDYVQSCLGGRKLEYNVVVDPALIGGFTIKVDSYLLDASISNELRNLRLKLLSRK